MVARVAAARQRPADGRHAGGAAGHLLPLVHKQLGLGSISVGEPFFNTMFTADGPLCPAAGGGGLLVRWGRDPATASIEEAAAPTATVSCSAVGTLPWLLEDKIIAMTAVGMAMACWIAVLAVAEAVQRVSPRHENLSQLHRGMVAARTQAGGGDTASPSARIQRGRDVRMRAGDNVTIHDHFTFREVQDITGPAPRRGGPSSSDAPRRAGERCCTPETALQHQPDGDDDD